MHVNAHVHQNKVAIQQPYLALELDHQPLAFAQLLLNAIQIQKLRGRGDGHIPDFGEVHQIFDWLVQRLQQRLRTTTKMKAHSVSTR
jgi:hypothetical protein